MQTHIRLCLALVAFGLLVATTPAFAQGTAFSYEGHLLSDGSPVANGLYDFQFALSNAPSGGNQVGSTLSATVGVTNGLFNTTLDFGAVFTGNDTWLGISVRPTGTGNYVGLAPLQKILPTPNAIYAESVNAAGLTGTIPAANFAGTYANAVTLNNPGNSFNGNGGGLTNLNAAQLTGTLPLARLPSGLVTNNESGVTLNGSFSGDGSKLTGLDASQLTSIGNTNVATSFNFFIGLSGNSTTIGYFNTAVGPHSLNNNTAGSINTAFGGSALYYNTIGVGNTACGYIASFSNTTGSNNVAVGSGALQSNLTGSGNTAVGSGALWQLGSEEYSGGYENIAIGLNAGSLYTSVESSNIDIGNPGVAGENNTIRIGSVQTQTYIAGVINGNGGGLTNIAVDAAQLTSIGNTNVGAFGNYFVGPAAGNSTTSGNQSTALGVFALGYDTSGTENTAIGNGALYVNTTGSHNTAVGVYALSQNQTGNFNTAVGEESLYDNTSGNNNTAIGYFALNFNKSGSNNVASGNSALNNNTSGSDNTVDGVNALEFDSTGNFNTAVGYYALWKLGYTGTTGGTNNIALGYQAAYNFAGTESSNIDIGNPGVTGENNTIRIGTSQTATYLAGTVYANGVALTSDRNAKENVTALEPKEVLAKVISLPVSEWNYKNNSADTRHIGPMAQDFHAAFQLDGADDKHISVVDEGGVALAAIQGLNQKLEADAKAKDAEIESLKQSLAELRHMVQSLAKNNDGFSK